MLDLLVKGGTEDVFGVDLAHRIRQVTSSSPHLHTILATTRDSDTYGTVLGVLPTALSASSDVLDALDAVERTDNSIHDSQVTVSEFEGRLCQHHHLGETSQTVVHRIPGQKEMAGCRLRSSSGPQGHPQAEARLDELQLCKKEKEGSYRSRDSMRVTFRPDDNRLKLPKLT